MNFKTFSLFLLSVLLSSARFSSAANENKASIYYFDPDYRVSFEMLSSLEKTAKHIPDLKLEKVTSRVTYTNCRTFILDNPERVTLKEFNSKVVYTKIGDTVALDGAKSFLYSNPPLPPEIKQAIEDDLAGYYTPQEKEAEILTGLTSTGKKFTAVSIKDKKIAKAVTPTLMLTFHLKYKGEQLDITGFSRPMGLMEFNQQVKNETERKETNLLLGITMGTDLSNEINMKFSKTINYLSDLKTDIVAVDRDDIKTLHEQGMAVNASIAASSITFICSNLLTTDPELTALIKPYKIVKLNGVTTAIVSFLPSDAPEISSNSATIASFKNIFHDEYLRELTRTLKRKEKAAVIVAVSQLEDEEFGKLLKTHSIDIVIGPKSWEAVSSKKERVELKDWNRDWHYAPALTVFRDSRGLGKITMEFGANKTLTAIESTTIEHEPDNSLYDDEYSSFKEKLMHHFLNSDNPVLPDIRRVYPDSGSDEGYYFYYESDFYNIIAALLKKEYKTEIALAKIRPLSVTVPGDISSSLVKSWIKQNDKIVLVKIPGLLLKKITPQIIFKARTGKVNANQLFTKKDFFSISGMDSKGYISGLKVQDTELYQMALSESALAALHKFPEAKAIKLIRQEPVLLDTLIMDKLSALKGKDKPNPAWESAIRELAENQPVQKTLWRINLRNLSLLAVNTEVNGNKNFGGVSDSQVKSSGQTLIQGSGKLFSELYLGKTRLDAGVSADYGKVTVRPAGQPDIISESADQIIVEGEFKHETGNYKSFFGSGKLGPFANLAYDTEFSNQTGVNLRKIVRAKAGLKLYEGSVLQEFYSAFVSEQNFTNNPAKTNYAIEFGFKVNTLIPGSPFQFLSDGNYRNFAYSPSDTNADLKQRLEFNAKLSAKLYGDIMLSPFFKYYMATGKLFTGTATNTTIGVAIDYSRLVKLKY